QVRDHFDDDLRATVGDLQTRVRPKNFPDGVHLIGIDALRQAAAGGAALRVIGADGGIIGASPAGVNLGSPLITLQHARPYRVSPRPIFIQQQNAPVAFLQYAKERASTNTTLARIRLFLAAGVVGGALLALVAGLAVARRAMGPVQQLTHAAQQIARTR